MLQLGINLNKKKIFSDESRFYQNSDKAYIWMKRGEMSDDVYFDKSKFDLNSIMLHIDVLKKNFAKSNLHS